ncbi:type I-E CRISPR-associated protein Cse1/CasA [Leisingera sp. D0M16]|uniref:type I-E CRISPR-associated protein Cse1/CasA n=1 Tax=Leisingera coralii TaxID=3351347 RepID=UPI003B82B74C
MVIITSMPLNLISDAWIPVRLNDGRRRTIAPYQMADPLIAAPDWPRADLNLACYELLIGLVYMASPPTNVRDWARTPPDAPKLKARLGTFAEAFNLLGEGPSFLQDLQELPGTPSSPDLLFIDSAGGNTARNNADLMVHRDRYAVLDLPMAAMALYAFQQFAPSGGAGNRTSMRGGGPMVTLADPGTGLWDLVWANVPYGQPANVGNLPWMRATRTSEKGQSVGASQAHPVEAFFGMPRRLQLVGEEMVTGVIQRPYGTNYGLWQHPLSPYYCMKEGAELLPRHPSSGRLPYRNWVGIVLSDPRAEDGLRQRAECIQTFFGRYQRQAKRMIAGGWAMDNMKPKDFLWAELPLLAFDTRAQSTAEQLIEGANLVAGGMRQALLVVLAEGSAREAQLDHFWAATEGDFAAALAELAEEDFDAETVAKQFLSAIGRQALVQFQELAVPGMADCRIEQAGRIVAAHRNLTALVHGRSTQGKKLWNTLSLTQPVSKTVEKQKADA